MTDEECLNYTIGLVVQNVIIPTQVMLLMQEYQSQRVVSGLRLASCLFESSDKLKTNLSSYVGLWIFSTLGTLFLSWMGLGLILLSSRRILGFANSHPGRTISIWEIGNAFIKYYVGNSIFYRRTCRQY